MTSPSDVQSGTSERVEAPLTLTFSPARSLGWWDQTVLWFNLGVSLTGPVTALFVLSPFQDGTTMSLFAAFTAIGLGALLGAALLGAASIPAQRTGAPSMVLLRGLFGRRGSVVPTVLNIAQNIGWGTIEIIIIAAAATALTGDQWRPLWVVLAGVGATVMAVLPLGSVRWLRKVVIWLVLAATIYLFVQLLNEPLPGFTEGGWAGFGIATDTVIAVCVSYALLIGDYSRHSRTAKASFYGAWVGYGLAATAYISLGVVAFSTVVDLDGDVIVGLLAVPAGVIALLILTVDEVDEAFANVYSTTMSVHNVAPHLDRRWVSAAVGVIATSLALVIDLRGYQSFLFLIGSMFLPLVAVLISDWFVVSRGRWDLSETSPLRPAMFGSWLVGFVAYQLANPGYVNGWNDLWIWLQGLIGFTPPTWLAASWFALVVGALATLVFGSLERAPRVARTSAG
ncbi:MAG: cytosine permease [Actinomycetia bacterium]|nr:cytosine permease [Actinomycetes bacterium]